MLNNKTNLPICLFVGIFMSNNTQMNTALYPDAPPNTPALEGVIVRWAKLSDMEGIHNAHMRSIQQICSRNYTTEQIEAWGGRKLDKELRSNAILNDLVWVVELEKSIEGYGHLKFVPGEQGQEARMAGLFLTTRVFRRYFGKKLVELMFKECETRNVEFMSLDSTLNALDFYQKIGFKVAGEQKFEIFAGMHIECVPMNIHLTPKILHQNSLTTGSSHAPSFWSDF